MTKLFAVVISGVILMSFADAKSGENFKISKRFPSALEILQKDPSVIKAKLDAQSMSNLEILQSFDKKSASGASVLAANSPTYSPVTFPSDDGLSDDSAVAGYIEYVYYDEAGCTGMVTASTGTQSEKCKTNYPPNTGSMKFQFNDDKCTDLRVLSFSDMYCKELASTNPINTTSTCIKGASGEVAYIQSIQLKCVVGEPQYYTDSVVFGTYSSTSCSGQPEQYDAITANYCLNTTTSGGDDFDDSANFDSEIATCGSNSFSGVRYTNPNECAVSSAYPQKESETIPYGCTMEGGDDDQGNTDDYVTYTKISCTSGSSSSSSDSLSGGAIAGVVIGTLAGIAIIGAIVFFVFFGGATMFAGSTAAAKPPVQTAEAVNPINKTGNIQADDSKTASKIGADNL